MSSVAVITPAVKAEKYINMLKWFSKLVAKYSSSEEEGNLITAKINQFCEAEMKKGKLVLTEQMNDAILYLLVDKTNTSGLIRELIRLYLADDTARREAIQVLLENIDCIHQAITQAKQIIDANKEELVSDLKVAGIYAYILFGNLVEVDVPSNVEQTKQQ